MGQFVNLHTHTVGSLLDGSGQIDDYMSRADEFDQPALAITDHGNLHFLLDFYEAGEKYGVKPILGQEFYQARQTRFHRDDFERASGAVDEFEQRGPHHLTVLARDQQGYRNLIKLSSKAYTEGFYGQPRIDYELLEDHAEGLIVLSGCLSGAVNQALLRGDFDAALTSAAKMRDIVGKDSYFIEVMNHGIPEELEVLPQLIDIARRLDIKVVPTCDSHYVRKEDSDLHDLALCVSTRSTVEDENRFRFEPEKFYLHSYEEMVGLFDPQWLKNTIEIADSVDVKLSFDELYFPEFPVPDGEDLESYFHRRVWEGARERYGDPLASDVRERIEYELRVVQQMGFEGYFLVLSDIVGWAKKNGIPVGPGRGSAAGSCLSFVLRVTNLDPLKHGLLFERFLVEGRKSPPDIDIDIDDRQRDRVIAYIREQYGVDRVAHICTFSEVKERSAIRDAARALGYEYSVGDKIAKLVPLPVQGFSKSLQESLSTSEELKRVYESDDVTRKIIDAAFGLEGLYRQTGVHAGGIVISRSDITDFVPIMKKGDDAPVVTQWDMGRVEQNGLLKADFLGLRNLGVIDECVENVKKHRGIEIDIDSIPEDDSATFQLLREGRTQGVFQLESSGISQLAVELQPEDFNDIMAIISLYRPGPLGSGMHKTYINRKHGREPTSYPHPLLADILKDTYGTLLYQENLISISLVLAGFTPAEADSLRKAVGKKVPEEMAKMRDKFVDGCYKTNDIDPHLASKIFSDIEYFAAYGFNAPHAASYARISYETAYLKVHYPTEYMAALLSSVDDKKERAIPYLGECHNMGINVLSPSINDSEGSFTVESDNDIRFGLASIKGIGPAVIRSLLQSRDGKPYQSIYDFMRRCDPDLLNKKTIESLICSGAMDELCPEQKDVVLTRTEKMEVLDAEKKVLDFYITENPLVEVWSVLEPSITTEVADLEVCSDGEIVTLGGLLVDVNKFNTKRGQVMYTLTLEDLTGSVKVLVFPNAVKDNTFENGEIVLITGRVAHEGEDEHSLVKIVFMNVERPDIPEHAVDDAIFITCPMQPSYDTISKIQNLIKYHPGRSPVYIEFPVLEETDVTLRFEALVDKKIKDQLQMIGRLSV